MMLSCILLYIHQIHFRKACCEPVCFWGFVIYIYSQLVLLSTDSQHSFHILSSCVHVFHILVRCFVCILRYLLSFRKPTKPENKNKKTNKERFWEKSGFLSELVFFDFLVFFVFSRYFCFFFGFSILLFLWFGCHYSR